MRIKEQQEPFYADWSGMFWFLVLVKIIVSVVFGVGILYLVAILPRVFNRPDYTPFRNTYYAHRGLHDNEGPNPENSLAAFKDAVAAGYGIELDVQPTKDEVLVVFHDENLERVCNVKGNVRDYTYEELQAFTILNSSEKIPTFQEVLDVIDGKVALIVELKVHAKPARVCELANMYLTSYKGLFCIESFHPMAVYWYAKHRPEVVRGQLSTNLKKEDGKVQLDHFIVQHLLLNLLAQPDFIAYCHLYPNELSEKICRKLYKILGACWTIRSQEELEAAKKYYDMFIFEGFLPKK